MTGKTSILKTSWWTSRI